MYILIRQVHLYVGMVVLTFLLMYFVTGFFMIHPDLLPEESARKTTETHELNVPKELEGEALSVFVQNQLGLGGKRFPAKAQADGGQKLFYLYPGASHNAVVSPSRDRVEVTTTHSTAAGVASGMHRFHKGGGGWKYDVWLVLYDIASLSLIIFAGTGIYLWYKRTRKRALGWTLLAFSFSYAAAVIAYLVHAP
jgi:hypothetical protein